MESGERVAIIREVGYGLRDVGRPCLWFTTYLSEHSAAVQVLTGKQADQVIIDAGVRDVHDLEGKPCWVECEAGSVRFLRVWKP